MQSASRKVHGFNASHVDILNDEQARRTFNRVLEEMDGKHSLIQ